MKKILAFVVLAFSLSVISCGKDDVNEVDKPSVDVSDTKGDEQNEAPTVDTSDTKENEQNETPKQNPFVGTWEIMSMNINGRERVLTDCEKKSYAVFQETTLKTHISMLTAGICTEKPIDWTYTVSDNKIFGKSDEGLVAEIPFVLNDETLTLTFVIGNRKLVSTYKKRQN
ncbi:MAG: lipocalin family protein [Capnocytophaga felis]|nr:lipocalin family protein [Capnocytophaga felis]